MKPVSICKAIVFPPRRVQAARAFTLPEMMVSVLIFSMMILAVVGVWLFCLRWDELVCSKLGASDVSRMGFDTLASDIRSAKLWQIGNGAYTNFVALPNETNLVGNAVQVYANSNITNCFTRYWYDSTSNPTNWTLYRNVWTNGVAPTDSQIIAQNLTNLDGNGMTFHAEMYNGSLSLNLTYKYVVCTTLEFCQYQYPLTKVGPGYYYNYYGIQLKLASHCPN